MELILKSHDAKIQTIRSYLLHLKNNQFFGLGTKILMTLFVEIAFPVCHFLGAADVLEQFLFVVSVTNEN